MTEKFNTVSETIIPAEPGLRCVIWPVNEPYWTHNSGVDDEDMVNQMCYSVLAWSIVGNKIVAPILITGKSKKLSEDAFSAEIALFHANGTVEWQGQFFASAGIFVRAARKYELSLGK